MISYYWAPSYRVPALQAPIQAAHRTARRAPPQPPPCKQSSSKSRRRSSCRHIKHDRRYRSQTLISVILRVETNAATGGRPGPGSGRTVREVHHGLAAHVMAACAPYNTVDATSQPARASG